MDTPLSRIFVAAIIAILLLIVTTLSAHKTWFLVPTILILAPLVSNWQFLMDNAARLVFLFLHAKELFVILSLARMEKGPSKLMPNAVQVVWIAPLFSVVCLLVQHSSVLHELEHAAQLANCVDILTPLFVTTTETVSVEQDFSLEVTVAHQFHLLKVSVWPSLPKFAWLFLTTSLQKK